MEEKNTENKKNYHRRRRRSQPKNGGQNQVGQNQGAQNQSSQNQGGQNQGRQNQEKIGRGNNGGYTNQIQNRPKKQGGGGQENSSRERKGGQNRRKRGYQPDMGKDAIRTFDLGAYTEGEDMYLFTFDRGTYRILKGKELPEEEPETAEPEETTPAGETEKGETDDAETQEKPYSMPGARFDRENAEELLQTRDKVQAYQAWNDIKRPRKGKHEKEQKDEEQGNAS